MIFLWIFLVQSQRRSQDPGNLRLTTSQHQQQLGAAWSLRAGARFRDCGNIETHLYQYRQRLDWRHAHNVHSVHRYVSQSHPHLLQYTASPCGQPILVKVGSILITLLQLGLSVISVKYY